MKRNVTSIVLLFIFFLLGYYIAPNLENTTVNYESLDQNFQQNFAAFKIAKKEFPVEYRAFLKSVQEGVESNESSFNRAKIGNAFFKKLARMNKEKLYNMSKKDLDTYFLLTIKFINQVNDIEGSVRCVNYFSNSATKNIRDKDFTIRHHRIIQEMTAKKIVYFANKSEEDSIPLNIADVKLYLFELNSKYPEILANNQDPNRGMIFCEKLASFYKDLLDDKSEIGYQSKKFLFLIENKFSPKEISFKYAAVDD